MCVTGYERVGHTRRAEEPTPTFPRVLRDPTYRDPLTIPGRRARVRAWLALGGVR